MTAPLFTGDCLSILPIIEAESVQLIYLDPPFFTQKVQQLTTRDNRQTFRFRDVWKSTDAYAEFLWERLHQLRRVLKPDGTLFFHCDRNATHIARLVLDDVFGSDQFRAEIIWTYRHWSNGQNNLLPAHQTIYFYSKSDAYKFNRQYEAYSPATNVDQILQKRRRDERNKAVYARDEHGEIVSNGAKWGVPLGDVWDIPYLNPKAKERTGYPTQKPLLLLERIITLATDPNDVVLDPFCGSGTTVVAAKRLGRQFIGIDLSAEAIALTETRLANPIKSDSAVLENGRDSYEQANENALAHLEGIPITPVQRNQGIDAILKAEMEQPILFRVQRPHESLADAIQAIYRTGQRKNPLAMIVIATQEEFSLGLDIPLPPQVWVVPSTRKAVQAVIDKIKQNLTINGVLP